MIDIETFREQGRAFVESMVPEFGREARRGLTDEQVTPHELARRAPPLEVVEPDVVRVGAGVVRDDEPAAARVDDG